MSRLRPPTLIRTPRQRKRLKETIETYINTLSHISHICETCVLTFVQKEYNSSVVLSSGEKEGGGGREVGLLFEIPINNPDFEIFCENTGSADSIGVRPVESERLTKVRTHG